MNEISNAIPPAAGQRRVPRGFLLAAGALVLCFSLPLYALARFALGSELYSHIVLVPFTSLGLVWLKRKALPPPSAPAPVALAGFLLGAGAVLSGLYAWLAFSGTRLATEDSLALTTLSFILLFAGICALFLGRDTLRVVFFPLCFLIFMAPFPVFARTALETWLQYGSAAAAYAIFKVSGTPVFFHEGLVFQLPGFSMQVAPECSGIHSSLALFITSVLAAWYFLRTPWKRAALALAVIPLALLRNGFRVFVIGELCVHVGPHMLHSYIHRQGGPVFFLLSLAPFFLLLYFLYRSDRRVSRQAAKIAKDFGRGHSEARKP